MQFVFTKWGRQNGEQGGGKTIRFAIDTDHDWRVGKKYLRLLFFHRFPNKPTIEGLEKCSIYDLAINAGNICKFEVSKILLR